jgi:hypothetical protein
LRRRARATTTRALIVAVGEAIAGMVQRNMREVEINLPTNYVKKEDFSKSLTEIKELCDKIFDKLDKLNDKKADK